MCWCTRSVGVGRDLLTIAVVGGRRGRDGTAGGLVKASRSSTRSDGAVLPILHLNGAKIAGPTVLGRKPEAEVRSLLEATVTGVLEVAGDDVRGCNIPWRRR